MADKTRLQAIQSTLNDLVVKINSIESKVLKIDVIEDSNSKVEKDLKDINDSITILKENVIEHLLEEKKRLNSKIKNIETDNKIFSDKIKDIEKNNAKTEQYDRRNNVELHGIPNYIEHDKLEEKIIDICNEIGVKDVNSNSIESCHRFGRSEVINKT